MRYSLTLSLPPEMIDMIDKEVATGRYLSKSEFIRDLLRDWEKKNLKTEQLKQDNGEKTKDPFRKNKVKLIA